MTKVVTKEPKEIASLNEQRARRFLKKLRDSPFITAVLEEDGKVHIYTKQVNAAEMQEIREALEEIETEE